MACTFQPDHAFCIQWDLREEDRCWVGIPRYRGIDLADNEGCDIGCFSCDDGGLVGSGIIPGLIPHQVDGHRWLRVHWDKPSRDASGAFSPLISAGVTASRFNAHALLVPKSGAYFRRAACWNNGGRECFDYKVCRCEPGTNDAPLADTGLCEDGTSPGGMLTGFFPDLFFFRGHLWNRTNGAGGDGFPEDSDIYCRSFRNDDTIARTVEVISGGAGLPTVLRTGGQAGNTSGPAACTANPFVGCAAKVWPSICNSGKLPADGYVSSHVTEKFNEITTRWGEYRDENLATIEGEFPRLRQTSERIQSPKLEAVTDIQNQALLYTFTQDFPRFDLAGSAMRFDRLDYDALSRTAPTNNNKLDSWSRGWNPHDGSEFSACTLLNQLSPDGTRFLTLPDCYLRNSSCGVSVDVLVAKVDISMGFMALNVDLTPNRPFGERLVPYARILVETRLAYRAQLTEACEGVAIVNAGDPGHSVSGMFCERLPEAVVEEVPPGETVPVHIQSPEFIPFYSGGPEASLAVPVSLYATGPVTIALGASVSVQLDDPGQILVNINGLTVGSFTAADCVEMAPSITMTKATWNALVVSAGEARISLIPVLVGASCARNFAQVTIGYDGVASPSVTGDVTDEIVYVHDGQVLDYPPHMVRWRGFLGEAGEHWTRSVPSPSRSRAAGDLFCCELKQNFRHVEVWGRPSQWGSRPEGVPDLHQGVVTLDFNAPSSCA